MTFEEYLTKRRVNVAAFASGEPQRFAEWQNWFGQMHPESFYTMVKMVLNDVRRNYWLAEVPKPAITTATPETATTAPVRPAGRRAPVARPATGNPEINTSETNPEIIKTPGSESAEVKPAEKSPSEENAIPKPARPVFKPRPIIKKTSETEATQISSNSEKENKPEEPVAENLNPETGSSANEIPKEEPAKPARPRAVIKRPTLPINSEDNTAQTPEKAIPELEKTVGDKAEIPAAETPSGTAKPARPRPVFKRPALENTSETGKTVGETPLKPEPAEEQATIENPVSKPGQEGASEAKAVSEAIQKSPEAAKAAEEISAEVGQVPQAPRPRPVFKRSSAAAPPAKSDVESVAAKANTPIGEARIEVQQEKPVSETNTNTENEPPKMEETKEEKLEIPAPKPTRPRPVFKRPSKTDDPNEPKNV